MKLCFISEIVIRDLRSFAVLEYITSQTSRAQTYEELIDMPPDFTEQMAYDLCLPWGPVDERLMEATFHGDPGFFFYCNHGLVYFLWHLQSIAVRGDGDYDPVEDYIYVPKAMGFRLNCQTAEQRFTYHYMYYRWYRTVFPTQDTDISLFQDAFFVQAGETKRMKPGLQLAIMKARELLGQGGKRDAAVHIICDFDWDAAVNEPVPDFADCFFDADEIWAEYRLSRAGKNPFTQMSILKLRQLKNCLYLSLYADDNLF